MRILRSHPSHSWRRLLGNAFAPPLLSAGLIAPSTHATPAPQAPTDSGITVSGSYNPGGTGCHGKENSAECLSWGLHIPSTIAPEQELTVNVEADSAPGQWTWTCPSESRSEGTATYFTKANNGEITKLASSGLGLLDGPVYTIHGDTAGRVSGITCTPEHLSLTYTIDSLVRKEGSYLDLSIQATAVAPGTDARSYTFSPKITTSADGTPQTPPPPRRRSLPPAPLTPPSAPRRSRSMAPPRMPDASPRRHATTRPRPCPASPSPRAEPEERPR